MTPGNVCSADASVFAGIVRSSTGGSSFFGSGLAGAGGATGTVSLALPGNSALRGGSGVLLPPPPPPPPGPGEASQMSRSIGISGGGSLAALDGA